HRDSVLKKSIGRWIGRTALSCAAGNSRGINERSRGTNFQRNQYGNLRVGRDWCDGGRRSWKTAEQRLCCDISVSGRVQRQGRGGGDRRRGCTEDKWRV